MAKTDAAFADQTTWYSLGYDTPPFSNRKNHNQFFFKSQALIHTLNKLCTLDTSETCITTLTGEAGSGKSTCLKSIKKIRTTYKNRLIKATRGLSPQNLIKAIFENNRKDARVGREPSAEDCISLLKALAAKNSQVRVLIDKAQNTPKETISLIKKLSHIQPNGSQIQFVLCCNNTNALPDLSGDPQIKTQTIQLKNLTREETEKYLHIKLQQKPPRNKQQKLSKEYIDVLFQKTQGNIYKINEEASQSLPQYLQGQSAAPTNTSVQEKKRNINLLMIPLGITAMLLVMQAPFHRQTETRKVIMAPRVSVIKQLKSAPVKPKAISKVIHILSKP